MRQIGRDLLEVFVIPITVSVILSGWFFHVQSHEQHIVVPVIFGFNGVLGIFEMSVSSMLTHISLDHFLGNTLAIFSYLLLFTVVVKNRWVVLQLGILLVPNLYLISIHNRVVGISGFASSILGCVFVLYLYSSYRTFTDRKASRCSKIAVGLVISILLFSSTQHIFDMFVYLDIVSIQNPGFAEILVHDLSDSYAYVSSKLHFLGLVFGLVLGSVLLYFNYLTSFSFVRR